MRLREPAIIILLLLLLAAAGCSRNGKTTMANPAEVVTVRAIEVKAEPVQRRVELVGTLEGNQEVTVSSEVAARVVAIRADLGSRVVQGQVLVELETTDFKLAVERQQAALAEALARLGMSREDDALPKPADTSVVRRASAELAEAKANYERARTLLQDGVVSQQLYDGAEARYRSAEANYTASLEEVRNVEARINSLRAQLAIARKSLSEASIRAPFAGTVRERLVQVGQYVKEQTAVMSLASTNPLKLRADVPERWFPHVKSGGPVDVTVEAWPGARFPGRVARVGQAITPQTRTFTIEAHVDNPGERLRPGLFAHALLTTSKTDTIVRVPAGAVISFYGVQKVYAIENGQVREHVVKLGDRFGDAIEVTEGLPSGSRIAVSDLTRIRQGSRVQVKMEK